MMNTGQGSDESGKSCSKMNWQRSSKKLSANGEILGAMALGDSVSLTMMRARHR